MKTKIRVFLFFVPVVLSAQVRIEPQLALGMIGEESILSFSVDSVFSNSWRAGASAEVVQGDDSDAWLYHAGFGVSLWESAGFMGILSLGAGIAVLQNASSVSADSDSFFIKQGFDVRYYFEADFYVGCHLGWMFVRPDKKVYSFPSVELALGVSL